MGIEIRSERERETCGFWWAFCSNTSRAQASQYLLLLAWLHSHVVAAPFTDTLRQLQCNLSNQDTLWDKKECPYLHAGQNAYKCGVWR